MEFGILGLELSGKTTLFSLLTGHVTAAAPHKREAHVGVAHVPDAAPRQAHGDVQAEEAHAGDGPVRGRPGRHEGRRRRA